MHLLVRRLVFAGVFLLLAGYGYITLTGPQGIAALEEKRKLIRTLEEENTRLARENEAQREHNRKLEESASEQELRVREKTKKIHQNETEFILPNSGKAEGGASEAAAPDAEQL